MKGTVEQRAPLPVNQVCQCYQPLAASVRSSLIDSVSSPAARSSNSARASSSASGSIGEEGD